MTPTQALAYSPGGDLLASAAGKVGDAVVCRTARKLHAFAPAASTAAALAFDGRAPISGLP